MDIAEYLGISAPQFANVRPTAAAEAALYAPFDGFKQYMKDVSRQLFPDIKLAVFNTTDNPEESIRAAVRDLTYSPEVHSKLPTGNPDFDIETSIHDQTRGLLTNFRKMSSRLYPLGTTEGFYTDAITSPEVEKAGGTLSPIFLARHCASCSTHTGGTTLNETGKFAFQLDRAMTGFHELGHAADFKGENPTTKLIKSLTQEGALDSQIESTADAFMAIMMVKEYGELGHAAVRNRLTGISNSSMHATHNAVIEALKWTEENHARLATLTGDEIRDVSRRIGKNEALDAETLSQLSRYSSLYATSANPEPADERLQRKRAARAEGKEDPNYTAYDEFIDEIKAQCAPVFRQTLEEMKEIKSRLGITSETPPGRVNLAVLHQAGLENSTPVATPEDKVELNNRFDQYKF